MVAASKMRKAQDAALAGRPFVRVIYRIQREATNHMRDLQHPLTEIRALRKQAIILVGADKGLCGPLNANIFHLASQFDPRSTVFITAGRKAAQFVARSGRQLAAEFDYGDSPRYSEACAIAAIARDLFLKREVDRVQIVATRFVNTLTQTPVVLEFLPVGRITPFGSEGIEFERELAEDKSGFVFEPGPAAILGFLLSHYLNIYVYQVLFNAKASEQSARMVSMKNATDSAESLIKDLTLEYNKIRQGNITKELLEIAGGQAS